jgi:hypothetical protein
MVLWCKSCGAFLGVKEPVSDWSVDRTVLCQECTKKQIGLTPVEIEKLVIDKEPPAVNT